MATVALVSCVARKQMVAAPAEELYISDWFLKTKAFVESKGYSWYILSPKYGLVDPKSIIEPYELDITHMRQRERDAWGRAVLSELLKKTTPSDKIVFLAGERYRERLVPTLKRLGYTIEIPMEGLRIGEQLSWLGQQLDR